MKSVISVFLLFAISLPIQAELSVKRIGMMVEKIQSKRIGKHSIDFIKVPSVFVVIPSEENRSKRPMIRMPSETTRLVLKAIVNDRAFINGKWVGLGDKVLGYRVEKIEDNKVLLKKDNKSVRLYFRERNESKAIQISKG
ncbi:hypothetical protein [Nitratifractor sp.]